MAKKAYFKAGGTSVLETTGGTDVSLATELKSDYERIYFSIAFYSDAERTTQVTPTAGTVGFLAYDDDLEMTVLNGDFGAADVYLGTRVQPAASGNFTSAKLTLTGVDTGLYVKAWVWQK